MTDQSDLLVEPVNYSFLEAESPKHEALSAIFPQPDLETYPALSLIEKNMISKLALLAKLGMGSRTVKSMSKDSIKKMSFIYEAERRESFDEDDLVSNQEQIQSSYSNPEGDFSLNFFQRTDSEVRQAYFNRLINMKILKLQPKKKRADIIIFDWDDTLLCTSYLAKNGLVNLSEDVLTSIRILDEKVSDLLENVTSLGETFIITNAHVEWVRSSGLMFLPKSYAIIQEKVKVVSARARYSEEFPDDTYQWKLQSFLDLKAEFGGDVLANIVCVGDSRSEIDAAQFLGQQFEQALVKTVKFKGNPGAQDLIKQVALLNERFGQIIANKTNLTIRLEKKQN